MRGPLAGGEEFAGIFAAFWQEEVNCNITMSKINIKNSSFFGMPRTGVNAWNRAREKGLRARRRESVLMMDAGGGSERGASERGERNAV